MYYRNTERLKLTAAHKKTLRGLEITEDQPGTILHDFGVMIDMLKADGWVLTPAQQLPLKIVTEINAHLKQPIEVGLKRAQQKSYPPVHGLYLALRASGLTFIDGTQKKPVLKLDETMVAQWNALNPTERYGVLLEAWLLRGKMEILNERDRWGLIPDNFEYLAAFYAKIPDDGLTVAGNQRVEDELRYFPGVHNLGLAVLFGLVNIEHGATVPGKGWQINKLYRTPLGDALLSALFEGFFRDPMNSWQLEDEGSIAPFGSLHMVLQPYLPVWQKNLTPPNHEFRPGTYTFKIGWDQMWRRIAIGAEAMLDELALVILDAVDFDNDHLYQFTLQTRFGTSLEITHPYLQDSAVFTNEVRVGDLPLRVGHTMIFLFDFGDNWEFGVTLEKVDENRKIKRPKLLESHGEAPEQYPNWDEDDWDDTEFYLDVDE